MERKEDRERDEVKRREEKRERGRKIFVFFLK